MKRPRFFEGVVVALVMSLVGSILFTALTPIFAGGGVLRLLIAGMSLGYLLYLLGRSHQRVGHFTVIIGWALLAGVTWLLELPLMLYLLVHLLAIWLIRSLYFYSSLLSSLADLGLNGLSLAAAMWAFLHTGSLFLGIWCFFLVQALFVTIPDRLGAKPQAAGPDQTGDERFERAHRSAQAAVRKLSSIY